MGYKINHQMHAPTFIAAVSMSAIAMAQAPQAQSSKGNTPAGLAIFGDPLIMLPGKKTTTSENLGKQTIDGIEYQGNRTTTTSAENPSLIGTHELWYAREVGLVALTKSSGPDERITARLHILDRKPPDPELFQIPTNYYIQELKDDAPAQ